MLTPNPVDERRLRDYVTWFEREGDQQPAQPGARHLGEDAVVRANLEWPKQPDLHLVILPRPVERGFAQSSEGRLLYWSFIPACHPPGAMHLRAARCIVEV